MSRKSVTVGEITIKAGYFGKISVSYPCPSCGHYLRSPAEEIGVITVCPECEEEFVTPGEAAMQAYERILINKEKLQEIYRKPIAKVEKKAKVEDSEWTTTASIGCLVWIGIFGFAAWSISTGRLKTIDANKATTAISNDSGAENGSVKKTIVNQPESLNRRIDLFIDGVSLNKIVSSLPNGLKIVDQSTKDNAADIENDVLREYLTKTYQGKPLIITGVEANGNSGVNVSKSVYDGTYDVDIKLMDKTKSPTKIVTTILYNGKQIEVELSEYNSLFDKNVNKNNFKLNKRFSPEEAIKIRDFSQSFLVQIHLIVDSISLLYDGSIIITVKNDNRDRIRSRSVDNHDFEKIYISDSDCKRIGVTYPYTLKK